MKISPLFVLMFALAAPALQAEPAPAYTLLMHGRAAEATAILDQALAANPGDGAAHLLLCRANLAQELADPAVAECQRAVDAMPASSEAQMWFGRALGLKAEHANPVSALSLAKRVRAAFERAVQLNPKDILATSDLAEFYLGAPGMVGGSPEKATALANSLLPQAPSKAHRLLALIAEKDHSDLATAEAEYKLAIAAGHTPEAWSDLALFYQRHKRYGDTLNAAEEALHADHERGPVEVDIASILTDAKRAPDTAIAALRAYLGSPNQTDAAPVFRVRVQLGSLLLKRGDEAGARYEFTTAVALAPNYEAARKALASL
jgi:tetratricopeptide (TPR) repeat protein